MVYQDEWVTAFWDISPVAPVHVLIVPNRHIESANHISVEDVTQMGRLLAAVPEVARRVGVDASGYRLMINTGRDGRQEIMHLHMHLMGGMRLPVWTYRSR
jgi:histidine triad (HIT) family protein